jgi:hypothetical protein
MQPVRLSAAALERNENVVNASYLIFSLKPDYAPAKMLGRPIDRWTRKSPLPLPARASYFLR